MKRKMALGMVLALLVAGMAGCAGADQNKEEAGEENALSEDRSDSGQEVPETEKTEEAEEVSETEKTQETEAETPPEEAAGAKEESVMEEKTEGEVIPDTEAMAFVKDMKTGWCLGNTLDAHNAAAASQNDLSSETSWGNPQTTREMIDAVRDAGFNTLRIPVTWHGHVTENEDGTFRINQVWLDRVQEVVDYAYEGGMYVILNIHHDTDAAYGYYPDSAHYEQSEKFVRSVWTELAERFKDYDSHLIFESLNEPRLVGSSYEWNFVESAQECRDSIDCINRLNQVMVDVVRAGGGQNEQRYIMVPGYSASLAGAVTELFVLPKDSAQQKIIVSVHAYTPYNFALQAPGEAGSTDRFSASNTGSTKEIDSTMDQLYEKFVSQGIPVVIGEYGARNKNNNTQDRIEYYSYYVDAARKRGITCCVWDNGAFGGSGELFGMFQRRECQFLYPEIVDVIMKNA